MDIVLIAGLWLEESAWAGVAARLGECGHRPVRGLIPGHQRSGLTRRLPPAAPASAAGPLPTRQESPPRAHANAAGTSAPAAAEATSGQVKRHDKPDDHMAPQNASIRGDHVFDSPAAVLCCCTQSRNRAQDFELVL